MANKIFILGLVIFILVMGFASAEVKTFGTFKSADQIRLIQVCDNSTYSNITSVILPDSSKALTEVAMSKNGNEYNYTFTNTRTLGWYIVNTHCNENGVDTSGVYNFQITSTGSKYGIYVLIFLLLSSIVLFILSLVDKNEYWGFISGSLILVLGIFSLINGIDIEKNDWTRMAGYVFIGFGLMVIFAAMYEMYQVKNGDSTEE